MFWWKKNVQNFPGLTVNWNNLRNQNVLISFEICEEIARRLVCYINLSLKYGSFSTYPSIAQEKNCRSEAKVGRHTCLIFLQNGWTHGGERWLVQALSRAKNRRGQASIWVAIGQDDYHFVKKEGRGKFPVHYIRSRLYYEVFRFDRVVRDEKRTASHHIAKIKEEKTCRFFFPKRGGNLS